MELAPGAYETKFDSATDFILEAAGVEQVDPAPDSEVAGFDSKL